MAIKQVVRGNDTEIVDLTAQEMAQIPIDEQANVDRRNLFAAFFARQQSFKNDPDFQDVYQRLQAASVADIDNWLTNNVTDLASARKIMAMMIKCLVTLMAKVQNGNP